MPSIVVTGAAGFLGGHVVERLVADGAAVLGVDREPAPAHLADLSGLTWLRADLTGGTPSVADALRAALGEAEAVLHLAGCPSVRDRAPDVDWRRQRDNVDATSRVLAATPASTPAVVTSSSSVYGGSRAARPCRETDPLEPRGGYAMSKVRAERLCAARLVAGGAVLVARPFTVAGERQRADMALSRWIDAARRGEPRRTSGSPDRSRDITDVRQVARALVQLLRSGATGTVNVGTGTAHRLADLVDAVRSAVGWDVRTVVVPARHEEVRHTRAATTRLETLLGWSPRTYLRTLVARQAMAQETAQPVLHSESVSA